MTAMLMEEAGTGGSIFRKIYSDFLKESYQITRQPILLETHIVFNDITELWSKVVSLFKKTAKSGDIQFIENASEILVDLSKKNIRP